MSNQNYLCIQRSQPGRSDEEQAPSPAQMEEMFAKFNAWKEQFQDNIIDMGGKLGGGCVVSSESTSDGPFVEAKEVVLEEIRRSNSRPGKRAEELFQYLLHEGS